MATNQKQITQLHTTNEEFRIWGKYITDTFAAAGWVLVISTINWASAARPGTSTAAGYEIWRTDDATVGNGLNNGYVKIEYGTGGSSVSPSIWFTAGWGNSSETLTGNVTARKQLTWGTVSGTFYCNGSGETGWIVLPMFTSTALNTNCFFINIERTRTIAGVEQDEFFIYAISSINGSYFNQILPRTGNIPTESAAFTTGQRLVPPANALYNGDYGVSTVAGLKGVFQMDAIGVMGADSTNFATNNAPHIFTVYGTTHTYILNGMSSLFNTGTKLLSRFE